MSTPLELRKLEKIQKLKEFREFLISGALYPDRPDFYYWRVEAYERPLIEAGTDSELSKAVERARAVIAGDVDFVDRSTNLYWYRVERILGAKQISSSRFAKAKNTEFLTEPLGIEFRADKVLWHADVSTHLGSELRAFKGDWDLRSCDNGYILIDLQDKITPIFLVRRLGEEENPNPEVSYKIFLNEYEELEKLYLKTIAKQASAQYGWDWGVLLGDNKA